VTHGYVNLGGDMRFLGPRPDAVPWDIGIQDPRDMDATGGQHSVSRGALATSGDYERYMEVDGQRYCHVLDPRSGMPVSYWRSVSAGAAGHHRRQLHHHCHAAGGRRHRFPRPVGHELSRH
jgi:thiamine biosynthesis lipoprotein